MAGHSKHQAKQSITSGASESAVGDVPNGSPQALGPQPPAGATVQTPANANGAKIPRSWEELTSDTNNACEPLEDWVRDLTLSVRERLTEFLQMAPAAGGINLKGKLHQQQPLQISSDEGPGAMATYREHWRWPNCKKSLESNGLYEAPGNLFWLSTEAASLGGQPVPGAVLTYGHIAAGRQMWSDEKYNRSHADPHKRHYIISGAIPTCVNSVVDTPPNGECTLAELPCFSSRSGLCGWYTVMDDALRAGDKRKVMKLYEAALSMPLRLRCGPDIKQITLDSITYSEDLFASNLASSDSFFDFALKVVVLLGDVSNHTRNSLTEAAAKIGLSFHGKKFKDNHARDLQHVAPYVTSPLVQAAFKAFENVSNVLNDQTRISTIFQNVSTNWGKGTQDSIDVCVQLFWHLRTCIVYKDIAKKSHVTGEFLIGTRYKPGYVQLFYKHYQFIEVLKTVVITVKGEQAEEAVQKIFPKMCSIDQFVQYFAEGNKSSAAVGARAIDEIGSAQEPDAAEEIEDSENLQQGLGQATAKEFDRFMTTLTPTGKTIATILVKTHTGAFDDDFKAIAAPGSGDRGLQSFPWGSLFNYPDGKCKDKDKIGGVSVLALRQECIKAPPVLAASVLPSHAGSDRVENSKPINY